MINKIVSIGCLEKPCRLAMSIAIIFYLCYVDDIPAIWDVDMAFDFLFVCGMLNNIDLCFHDLDGLNTLKQCEKNSET